MRFTDQNVYKFVLLALFLRISAKAAIFQSDGDTATCGRAEKRIPTVRAIIEVRGKMKAFEKSSRLKAVSLSSLNSFLLFLSSICVISTIVFNTNRSYDHYYEYDYYFQYSLLLSFLNRSIFFNIFYDYDYADDFHYKIVFMIMTFLDLVC